MQPKNWSSILHSSIYFYGTKKFHKAKRAKSCIYCGKITTNEKYCSYKCVGDYNWEKKIENFEKNGQLWGESESYNQRCFKKYLIQIRGHQCCICKKENWEQHKIPLVLDHIDGNSLNWDLKNLRLVCGNCDMLLPTYKSKNKGNGRHNRRKRYAEGKSY